MLVEKWQCDRPGCSAVSNGDVENWWSVRVNNAIHVWPRISLKHDDTEEAGTWKDYCGMEHTLAAISDAMRAMCEAK